MKTLPVLIAAALLPLAAGAAPPQPMTHGAMAAPAPMVMMPAAQMQWGDGPPALPKGAQAVVLSGDPQAAGPFVLRLKAPAGYKVPMHWHPSDEQVTVIQGDFTLTSDDGTPAHRFDAGGYALLPAKMHHEASTQGGAIVQVSSTGPFEITYIDPKNDPRQAQPAP
jgi:anti-sigma factor ChrR (cupin superfamily)